MKNRKSQNHIKKGGKGEVEKKWGEREGEWRQGRKSKYWWEGERKGNIPNSLGFPKDTEVIVRKMQSQIKQKSGGNKSSLHF